MLASLALLIATGLFGVGDGPEALLAPPGRWTTRGGGPARCGASASPAVRGPIEVAWTHDAGGAIEGEPVVWDDVVVIAVRRSADQRLLRVLDLLTGEALARDRVVRSSEPLEPSIWWNAIVYRSAPSEITAVRIGRGALTETWSHACAGPVGPPLVTADGVFAADTQQVLRLAPSLRAPVWTRDGGFEGALSRAGDSLYAVLFDELRQAFLVELDPRSGEERRRGFLGRCATTVRHSSLVACLPEAVYVDLGAPLATNAAGFAPQIVGLAYGRFAAQSVAAVDGSTSLLALPVPYESGWLATLLDHELQPALGLSAKTATFQYMQLASARLHPELIAPRRPVSRAGQLAIAGATAFDLGSRRIQWRAPVSPSERAVVARETVLFVDTGRRLVAVRSKTARRGASIEPGAGARVSGLLVLRDGSIERGEFQVDLERQRILRGLEPPDGEWRIADALCLVDREHHFHGGVDPLRGLEHVARDEQASAYLALAREARSTNDSELIAELIDLAAAHGCEDRELAKLEQHADNLRTSRNKASLKRAEAEAIRARALEVARLPAEIYWRFARDLPGPLRPQFQAKLLRAALERDPAHREATEAVRALIPGELRPQGAFDALDALALIEALPRAPFRVVPAPAPDKSDASFAERALEARRRSWRDDLYAVQSANLVVITPVEQLGALAQCLALGEIVCRTLEELFEVDRATLGAHEPMVVELNATREEYLGRTRTTQGRALEWSAGHYDMIENVSRFYMSGTTAEFEDVLRATAHELTHHWLRARCPRWPYRALTTGDVEQAGFWVVEGFACLIDGFGFDVESGAWVPGGAESERLDLVANAGEAQLIPWERFFGISFRSLQDWKLERVTTMPSTLVLGTLIAPTIQGVFYGQATATARYLFEAEGGALRPKLFEFLRAYYAGESSALDLPARLGFGADELGRRIVEHARATLAGR